MQMNSRKERLIWREPNGENGQMICGGQTKNPHIYNDIVVKMRRKRQNGYIRRKPFHFEALFCCAPLYGQYYDEHCSEIKRSFSGDVMDTMLVCTNIFEISLIVLIFRSSLRNCNLRFFKYK
ncbi:uncharacterized protein LOC128862170 [Anastrepha ludens]|uniref:uncharacterized protein LOC128862170 n=1 Tax=Anastrepha ludens TaxID=28586 RepID=UPI0023AF3ED4|nr:uncharacterized protein LOC128862170 [Anastrepha ludens]